jgi:hypothetical protein
LIVEEVDDLPVADIGILLILHASLEIAYLVSVWVGRVVLGRAGLERRPLSRVDMDGARVDLGDGAEADVIGMRPIDAHFQDELIEMVEQRISCQLRTLPTSQGEVVLHDLEQVRQVLSHPCASPRADLFGSLAGVEYTRAAPIEAVAILRRVFEFEAFLLENAELVVEPELLLLVQVVKVIDGVEV